MSQVRRLLVQRARPLQARLANRRVPLLAARQAVPLGCSGTASDEAVAHQTRPGSVGGGRLRHCPHTAGERKSAGLGAALGGTA